MKKVIISLLIILLIGVASLLVIQKGLGAKTTYEYGIVDESAIPKQFETVRLTMDVFNENGEMNEQSFIIETKDFSHPFIKLHVKKEKVVDYEFVEEKEMPEKALTAIMDNN